MTELNKTSGVALTMQGRSAGISVERQDPALFPFEAFSFDNPNETVSPVLSMAEPWVLNVGEISTSSITNFYEDVRTAAETDEILAEIDVINANLQSGYTSWFYDGTPTLLNEPAVNWTDDPTKDDHLGDVYYDGLNGKSYHFVSDVATVYYWKEWIDSGVTAALQAASEAQDTADGKRRVFTSEPIAPYDVGDLWTRGETLGVWVATVQKSDVEFYNIADWSVTTDATNDDSLDNFVDTTYAQFVEDVEAGFADTLNGRDFLAFHLEKIAKDLQNVDADHEFSMSQITVGQGQLDIRVGAVPDGYTSVSEAWIALDAAVGDTSILIGTVAENVDTSNDAIVTLETDLFNSDILIQTNADGIDYHNESFIALGADPNGSLINISSDKITLSGSINLDDTIYVDTGIVKILGTLEVGTISALGTGSEIGFKVETNGDITCNNLTANSGSFTGDIYADNGTFAGDVTGAFGEFNGTVKVTSGIALAEYTSGSVLFNVLGDVSSIQPSLSGGNWGLKLSSGNSETNVAENLLTSGYMRSSGGHRLILKAINGSEDTIYDAIKALCVNTVPRIAAWMKDVNGDLRAGVIYMKSGTTAAFDWEGNTTTFQVSIGSSTFFIDLWV
jgi:hypothetical protein